MQPPDFTELSLNSTKMMNPNFSPRHIIMSPRHVIMCEVVMSDCMFLSCHTRVSESIHTLKLSECQGAPCSKQTRNLKFTLLQLDSNHNHLVHKRTL